MLRVLIFAGLGLPTKSTSGAGSLLSSGTLSLAQGLCRVCEVCCAPTVVLTWKKKFFLPPSRVGGRVSKMCPKVPQTPVEALAHLEPPCQALGSKTTLLMQVRALKTPDAGEGSGNKGSGNSWSRWNLRTLLIQVRAQEIPDPQVRALKTPDPGEGSPTAQGTSWIWDEVTASLECHKKSESAFPWLILWPQKLS